MAKSASFFTLRSGSTKSLTFQVYRGKQITKDRVSEVSNPQTTPQMYQRMKLAQVAAAAARLKGLVNHSFEGVEYGWRSIAEFRRLNLEKSGGLQIGMFIPKGMADAGIANYLISKGSLQSVSAIWGDIATTGSAIYVPALGGAKFPDSVTLSVSGANATKAEKWNAFIDAFLALKENSRYALGDQLTFLIQATYAGDPYKWVKQGVTSPSSDEDYNAQRRTGFVISRLILEKDNSEMIDKWTLDVGNVTASDANKYVVNYLSDGYIDLSTSDNDRLGTQSMFFQLSDSINNDEIFMQDQYRSCAVILSRKSSDGTSWQRSTQRLVVNPDYENSSANLVEYTYLKSSTASSKYLNQGNSSTGIMGDE